MERMNAKQVAAYTGLSRGTIEIVIKRGGLKGFVPKGLSRRYYSKDEVDAWIRGEELQHG